MPRQDEEMGKFHAIELMERVGAALYGERWRTDIAKVLGVDDRTIHNWIKRGKFPALHLEALKAATLSRLSVLVDILREL